MALVFCLVGSCPVLLQSRPQPLQRMNLAVSSSPSKIQRKSFAFSHIFIGSAEFEVPAAVLLRLQAAGALACHAVAALVFAVEERQPSDVGVTSQETCLIVLSCR